MKTLISNYGKSILGNGEEGLLARLRERPRYQELYPVAFPGPEDPFTLSNTVKAIATFQRTIVRHGAVDPGTSRFYCQIAHAP